ncbi:E3 binding domain-containing protein, partial [Aquimarina celericrescens]|nr:E3 binding domain-containing protein [Aquimarina celericrescens]
VPAPCSGVITEIRCQANEVVEIGRVIAIIDADAESAIPSQKSEETKTAEKPKSVPETSVRSESRTTSNFELQASGTNDGFLSPLVISIAKKENVTIEELQNIGGTGTEGRIRKSDLIQYVKNRKYPLPSRPQSQAQAQIPKSTYK